MDNRYHNKPFLLLLEGFVLDAIGALPPEIESAAEVIATKVFEGKDWRTQLQAQIGLPKDFAQQLSGLWAENQKIAEQKGVTLAPKDFAQALVEANFSEIVEMAAADVED